LIYGIPTLSAKQWEMNLEKFLSFNLVHLSAYALTVEPKTALEIQIKKGKVERVSEEKAEGQFKILTNFMQQNNYEHYEISNFCLNSFYSKHNRSYWSGKKYLGLGPSAHSFDGVSRQWNVSNVNRYIQSMNSGNIEFDKEFLTPEQKFNEYILTSIRTMWGIEIKDIKQNHGDFYVNHFLESIKTHIIKENIITKDEKYWLSENGKLFADNISADLFV